MEIQKGDRVLVNLAPFIGSVMRSEKSVPCRVLDVDGIQAHVRTEPPHREIALWVLGSWIEKRVGDNEELLTAEESLG